MLVLVPEHLGSGIADKERLLALEVSAALRVDWSFPSVRVVVLMVLDLLVGRLRDVRSDFRKRLVRARSGPNLLALKTCAVSAASRRRSTSQMFEAR
jgi:hypothetical protein